MNECVNGRVERGKPRRTFHDQIVDVLAKGQLKSGYPKPKSM